MNGALLLIVSLAYSLASPLVLADLNAGCKILVSELSGKLDAGLEATIHTLKPSDPLTAVFHLRANVLPEEAKQLRSQLQSKKGLKVFPSQDPFELVVEGRMKSILRILRNSLIERAELGVSTSADDAKPASATTVHTLAQKLKVRLAPLTGIRSFGTRITTNGYIIVVKLLTEESRAKIPAAFGGVPVQTESVADE